MCDWNQSRAARYLDISRKTLLYRIEKHRIQKNTQPLRIHSMDISDPGRTRDRIIAGHIAAWLRTVGAISVFHLRCDISPLPFPGAALKSAAIIANGGEILPKGRWGYVQSRSIEVQSP